MTNQNVPAVTDKNRNLDRAARVIHKALDRIWGYDAPEWADTIAADLDLAGVIAPAPPTLADMTEEEQRDAVGTWARVEIGKGEYTGIIDCTPEKGRLVLLRPGGGAATWSDADKVTPLPELGRAYNPDGTPAPRTGPGVPAPRLQELLDSVAGSPADDDPVRALGALMSGLTGLIREAMA